ncbi:hypothetical protein BDV18DRAFT_68134 [Aspergillus unguis]
MRNNMFPTALMDQVVAQPYYPADNEVTWGPQPKRDVLSIQHTLPSDSQQEMDRSVGCINNSAETESKGRGATRRRIQVACMRCRKRKIKCSGDVGGGLGCSNCQSAGNIQCQFLRVNSSILQTKAQASSGSGWPYPASDVASRAYAPSMSSARMGGLSAHHPNNRTASFSRVPEYEVVHGTQNPYGPQPFGIDSTINYEDESSTPYNVQTSSAYMLPNSPQVFMADYCGLGWNSKNWGAVLQGGRAPAETLFSEGDTGTALAHPAYSYVVPGQGQQAHDALSMAPPQAPMVSSGQAATERTLPDPANRNQYSGNNAITEEIPSAQEHKPSNRMVSRCEARPPIMPSSSNMPFSNAPVDRKMIPSSGPDMTFGFLPGAPSSATSTLPPSGSFTSLEATACASEAGDEFRGSSDGRYRTFTRENRRMMSMTEYRPDTYGYNRPAYRGRSDAGDSSDNKLITGMHYERPAHPASPLIDEKHTLQAITGHSTYTGLCSQ